MKIAIIGANGQLGSDLTKVFSRQHDIVALNHSDIDISSMESLNKVIGSIKPDVILNTAAFHNVPKCEEDPEMAYRVNGIGSLNLAMVSNEYKCTLVHYSTDYVFDGEKRMPYLENDNTNPLNVYAVTKLAGENFVRNYSKRGYIIRISGIYGSTPCRAKGGNFITTMVRLCKEKPEVNVVNDEVLTPTATFDIALNSLLILKEMPEYGLYHMTCEGECSWYEFAREIFSTLNLKTPLNEISVSQIPLTVKRPFYSVLENQRLKANSINFMPHWKESLNRFLNENYLS